VSDHQADRVFQAIDGYELAHIIGKEIERQCLTHPQFRKHLTYPLCSFAANIVVTAYPMDPGEFALKARGEFRRASASALAADAKPEIVTVAAELNIDAPAEGGLAPDEARVRVGLPVTAPTKVPGGTADLADATLSKQPEMEDPAVIASSTPSQRQQKALADQRNPRQTKVDGDAAGPSSSVPKNRAGASPNFARSINLTTRAEPGGEGNVRIDENVTNR